MQFLMAARASLSAVVVVDGGVAVTQRSPLGIVVAVVGTVAVAVAGAGESWQVRC